MATPRRHWFRVADSIADEDWSDAQLATVVRLMALLNTRWARNGLTPEEARTAQLSKAQVYHVTKRFRLDSARYLLRSLSDTTGIAVRSLGDTTEITWPKWSEFQKLRTPELPESRPLRKTPPQDARRPRKEEEESGLSAAALVNLLGKEDREKALPWLTETLPQIEADARKEFADKEPTPGAFMAAVKSAVIRYWRQHKRNPSGPLPKGANGFERERPRPPDAVEVRRRSGVTDEAREALERRRAEHRRKRGEAPL